MPDFSKTSVSIFLYSITMLVQPAVSCLAALEQEQSNEVRTSKWVRYTRAAERAVELNRLADARKLLDAALREAKKTQQSIYRQISTLKELAILQSKQGAYSLAVKKSEPSNSVIAISARGTNSC